MSLLGTALLGALMVQTPQPRTHVLIVSGIGGDEEHRTRFVEWGTTMVDAASMMVKRARWMAERTFCNSTINNLRRIEQKIGWVRNMGCNH